jgi:hypothetical protein|tara:strand:- start:1183 stop:1353 length:171 start_codon:yes stop_codon:yes gene_type:complete
MKIKLLSSTAASGTDLLAGSIAEVSDSDGRVLIGMGKAEACLDKVDPPKATKKKSK